MFFSFYSNLVTDTFEFLQFFSTTKGNDDKQMNFIATQLLKKAEIPTFTFSHTYNRKKHAIELFVTCEDKDVKLDPKMFPNGIKMFVKEYHHGELHTIEVRVNNSTGNGL